LTASYGYDPVLPKHPETTQGQQAKPKINDKYEQNQQLATIHTAKKA
jgi:hypothetical protein